VKSARGSPIGVGLGEDISIEKKKRVSMDEKGKEVFRYSLDKPTTKSSRLIKLDSLAEGHGRQREKKKDSADH